MAEFENDVTDDVTDDVETSYEDNSYEDETQDSENTTEQYSKSELRVFRDLKIDPENATMDDFKKITKILAKTQDKMIKSKNTKGETESTLSEKDLELREEVWEFLLENKDLKPYKSEILKYRKQGYNMKQAIALIENDDTTIENRRKTKSINITNWETSSTKTTYTKADLDNPKLSQEEYNKIMAKVRSWEIKLK